MAAWTALGVEGLFLAFIVGVAGIPPRELGRRWLSFFILVGFLTLMVAPANPARARFGLWVVASTILIKNSLALLTMLVLAGTTPFHRLLSAHCASWAYRLCSSPRSSSWTDTVMFS